MKSVALSIPAAAVVHDHNRHAHGDGHTHDDHHHGHGHHHHHDHGGHLSDDAGRAHALPERPLFSLMRLSAGERLAASLVMLAGLWACVWWALQ